MGKVSKIKGIKAREILDSKGNPTVEIDLITNQGIFRASVPSGVSKGKYEAIELRDGGKRYFGMGVLKAIKTVNEIIAPKLMGKNPTKQKEIDDLMIELDGTENKSKLGANAILPVSVAVCRAGAKAKNIPLYDHISQLAGHNFSTTAKKLLQGLSPCLLMIEGGLHAGNGLDVQEFMIVPSGKNFEEKLRIGTEIYHSLGSILEKKYGNFATNVGYEGGFAPPLVRTKTALDLIMKVIKTAGYKGKAKIILDVAASHFFKNGIYNFERGAFTKEGFLNFYSEIIENFPILGLEDPFSQDDWGGWQKLKLKIKNEKLKILIIGDDLLATNPKRMRMARERNACNAAIIKPNQIGTITETLEAGKIAKSYGWKIIVSHRSSETNDDFISDLAVGMGADFIKAGAPTRGERVAKYNRLLMIEEEI